MRKILENSLPIYTNDYKIRLQDRDDLERFFHWPDYPKEYSMFNGSIKSKSLHDRDSIFLRQAATLEFIPLVVDYKEDQSIGKFTLIFGEDKLNVVENMGIRLHPKYCNKGIGTLLLNTITEWCFINDIKSLSLDVLASNERAVNCYKRAGYKVTRKYVKYDDYFLDMMIHS